MKNDIKAKLLGKCIEFIDKRVDLEAKAIERAKIEAAGEEKSSAGDKYETSRAMMHLEQEKYARALDRALELKKSLLQIDFKKKYDSVQPGALVITDIEKFFFAISADELEIDGEIYLTLSFATPLGQALAEKREGDVVDFRGTVYTIEMIM